jgi:hypothetical protein
VRLNVEAIRDANIGFGLLARMNKGTVMTFTRRFVNNEVWLPGPRRLHHQGSRADAEALPAGRHDRVLELPEVHGRHQYDDRPTRHAVARALNPPE